MTPFEEWYLRHEDKFKTYTTQEIVELAIASGFSREEVTSRMFKDRRAA